jgi:hypothetical protein
MAAAFAYKIQKRLLGFFGPIQAPILKIVPVADYHIVFRKLLEGKTGWLFGDIGTYPRTSQYFLNGRSCFGPVVVIGAAEY